MWPMGVIIVYERQILSRDLETPRKMAVIGLWESPGGRLRGAGGW